MDDFLAYLKAQKAWRLIEGFVHVTETDKQLPDHWAEYERIKWPIFNWVHTHHDSNEYRDKGRLYHRRPGEPRIHLAGSYEFWWALAFARFPQVTGFSAYKKTPPH